MASLSEFCQRLGLSPRPGATEAEVGTFEAATGLALPEEVRAIYRTSNGLDVDPAGFEILSLEGALPMARALGASPAAAGHFGYFPLTESNDSNPFCVACRPPLRGRVVHVMHDDDAELRYRDAGSFLDAVLARVAGTPAADERRRVIDSLPGGYRDSGERSPEEVATGRELLRTARAIDPDDGEHANAMRFGMTLLSAEQVDEVAKLLYEGHYVREAAVARLKEIGGEKADAAVAEVTAEMGRFSERAAHALRQAGVGVRSVSPHAIVLTARSVGLNMDFLFDERNRPDALSYVVERAKTFLAQTPSP
jgi:cell wall assembly regulator SMI1